MYEIRHGDCLAVLRELAAGSIDCVVTSPPYWGLRDYGVSGQLGLEKTPEEYVARLVEIFGEVRRVLKREGTLWLNLGDSYISSGGAGWQGKHGDRFNRTLTQRNLLGRTSRIGLAATNLVGMPWRIAFALQSAGWILRSDIIWHKRNPMPESVEDRPTTSHEHLFLLARNRRKALWRARDTREWSKAPNLDETIVGKNGKPVPRWKGFAYFYDADAIKEPCSEDTHARYSRARDARNKWAPGPGHVHKPQSLAASLAHMARPAGVNPKAAANGDERMTHQNGSFSAAVADLVETRNKRTVWTLSNRGYKGAHFATFPPKLVEPCILAGCPAGGVVLDPFAGSGTTGAVALLHGRRFIGIELNAEYVALAERRIKETLADAERSK